MSVIFTKGQAGGAPSPAEEPLFEDRQGQGPGAVVFHLRAEEKVFLENFGHPDTLTYKNQQGLLMPYPRKPGESNAAYGVRAAATGHEAIIRSLLACLLDKGLGGPAVFLSREDQAELARLAQDRYAPDAGRVGGLVQSLYANPRFANRAAGLGLTLTEYGIRRLLEEHQRPAVLALYRRVMTGGFDHLLSRQPPQWTETARSLWDKQEPLLHWQDEEHTARHQRDKLLYQCDKELDQYTPVIQEAARNHTIVTHPEVVRLFETMNAADRELNLKLEELEKKRRLSKINDEVLLERIHRHLRLMKFSAGG